MTKVPLTSMLLNFPLTRASVPSAFRPSSIRSSACGLPAASRRKTQNAKTGKRDTQRFRAAPLLTRLPALNSIPNTQPLSTAPASIQTKTLTPEGGPNGPPSGVISLVLQADQDGLTILAARGLRRPPFATDFPIRSTTFDYCATCISSTCQSKCRRNRQHEAHSPPVQLHPDPPFIMFWHPLGVAF